QKGCAFRFRGGIPVSRGGLDRVTQRPGRDDYDLLIPVTQRGGQRRDRRPRVAAFEPSPLEGRLLAILDRPVPALPRPPPDVARGFVQGLPDPEGHEADNHEYYERTHAERPVPDAPIFWVRPCPWRSRRFRRRCRGPSCPEWHAREVHSGVLGDRD